MTAKRYANRECFKFILLRILWKAKCMKEKYQIGKVYNCVKIVDLFRKNNRLWATVECIHCHARRDQRASDVLKSKTSSCRCQLIKHNLNTSRIYAIYHNMKYRCNTPTAPAYKHYGGRGIKVCEEWSGKESGFLNFVNWAMANGYSDDLTIDRIDIDGDYSPDNCRWITKSLNTGLSNKDHPRKPSHLESQSTIESIG